MKPNNKINERITESVRDMEETYHDAQIALLKAASQSRLKLDDKNDLHRFEEQINECYSLLQQLHISALDAKRELSSIMTGGLLDEWWDVDNSHTDAQMDAYYGTVSVNRELNRKIFWPLDVSEHNFKRCERKESSGEPIPFTIEGTKMKEIQLQSGMKAYVIIDERGLTL